MSQFSKLNEVLPGDIPTPPAGRGYIFIDSTDSNLYVKDDAGAVSSLVGPPGPASVPDPTTMTDIEATRLGYYQYDQGGTYNGGNSPTITTSSGTVNHGLFIPYQLQNGAWRMRFSIRINSAVNGCTLTINSVSFALEQNISVSTDGPTPDYTTGFGFCSPGGPMRGKATGTGRIYFPGDVYLSSTPNWLWV